VDCSIIFVSDSERPDVSGPIRSIGSRDLAPSILSTYPPPYLPWVMGTQFTGSLQEGWIWTVEWRFTASPTQNLCFWIMFVILSLFHRDSCFWRVYQMIVCLVLIAVIFLGWLTTTSNKRVSSCAFFTFSWAVSRTIITRVVNTLDTSTQNSEIVLFRCTGNQSKCT
jgi:hypothetical protein